jgi:hypothetical protein
MKSRICSSWVPGLVLLVLPLAGCLQENSISSQAVAAAEVTSPPETPTVKPAESSADVDTEEMIAEAEAQNISTAPAKKLATEIEVPANLKPSPATAEIIKLANAGVEESVMLSFVTNSLGTFNLRAEEIIYLNDIGVPTAVVTAMIQRDHLLQENPSNLMVTPEASLSAAVPNTSSADAIAEQPLNVVEPPMTVFDSAPGYSSVDYTVPVDTEPSPTDYTDYYDSLAPYGNWVDVNGYGRCWQPTVVVVNPGWTPYFNCGRWVYTDCGWYWMSDYSWGWAPFHYGRWFQHASLGWCWRPDRVWGPSWVCWRHDGDFCGWAPLPPGSRFVAGVGLTFHGHPARHDFTFGLTANHFRFVRANHFLERDLGRHVLPRDHATRIFDHTVASTGIISRGRTVVNDGLPRGQIATATHANIRPVSLHNVTPTAGVGIRERFERNGRTLAVYRPDMQPRTPARTDMAGRDQVSSNGESGGAGSTGLSGVQSHTRLAHVQPQRPLMTAPQPAIPSRTESPARTAQPVILRGSDHPRETAMTPGGVAITRPASPAMSNPQNSRRTVPLNSQVVIGQNRNSQVAANQTDGHNSTSAHSSPSPRWTGRGDSHGRPASAYNQDTRYHSSRPAMREYDSGPANSQPQSPAQSTWWAQPTQPRPSDQEQSRHNREMTGRGAGNWNATVQQPHQNPAPVHVPQQTYSPPAQSHQTHYAPVESRPSHSAAVESHQSRSVPVETHQSRPVQVETHQSHSAPAESHASHSAPAPAPSSSSSSSSSHDSGSHSSGRGR